MDTSENKSRWTIAPLPRGYQLVGLVVGALLLMLGTLIFGDSGFSNWGIETNTGWTLLTSGHFSTHVLAGARTDTTDTTAFARGGQTLVIDYNVTVEDGSAFINVYNNYNLAQDPLYYESIEHDQQRHLEIPVNKTGFYNVSMSYYSYRGTFDVHWRVE